MIICYTVPEIWHVTEVVFICHFGIFFALLPKNQFFLKMKKTPRDGMQQQIDRKNNT